LGNEACAQDARDVTAMHARMSIPIKDHLDAFTARNAVREMAAHLGYPTKTQWELTIAVSELATNIIKHAKDGTIELGLVTDVKRGAGIEIIARDAGPPIRHLETALQDGCDGDGPIAPDKLLGRAGIGSGLGAIVRLTDSFEYETSPAGKRIRVVRFRPPR